MSPGASGSPWIALRAATVSVALGLASGLLSISAATRFSSETGASGTRERSSGGVS